MGRAGERSPPEPHGRRHELAREQGDGRAREAHQPPRLPRRVRDGRLGGGGVGLHGRHPAGHAVQPHHRLRRRAVHRRLHRVLLRHQRRPELLPARLVRGRLVARRLLELVQRHPVLHRLHAVLLRPEDRLPELLRRLPGVPLRRRLRHAQGVLQLLPLRAVPPGDHRDRADRVPRGHVRAAVPERRVGLQHRRRGRQLHRGARHRLPHDAATRVPVLPSMGAVVDDRREGVRRRGAHRARQRERADVQQRGVARPAAGARRPRSTPGSPSATDTTGAYVFGRGFLGALFYNRYKNGAWEGQKAITGPSLTSDPVAVRVNNTRIQLFARSNSNYAERGHHRAHRERRVAGLELAPGLRDVEPRRGRRTRTGSSCSARGYDGALWWRRFVNGVWGPWASLGGNLASDPSAVTDGNQVWVFVRIGGRQISYKRFDGGNWSGWQGLGGSVLGDPKGFMSLFGPTVFARDDDGPALVQRRRVRSGQRLEDHVEPRHHRREPARHLQRRRRRDVHGRTRRPAVPRRRSTARSPGGRRSAAATHPSPRPDGAAGAPPAGSGARRGARRPPRGGGIAHRRRRPPRPTTRSAPRAWRATASSARFLRPVPSVAVVALVGAGRRAGRDRRRERHQRGDPGAQGGRDRHRVERGARRCAPPPARSSRGCCNPVSRRSGR